MSVKEVQDVLRVQHIVITDFPLELVGPTHGPVAFDEAGLHHLRNLESPIKFQGTLLTSFYYEIKSTHMFGWSYLDQSIAVGEDHSVQICTGTLDHLLASAREEGGAIVNALSFRLPLSAIEQNTFSSDVEAWRVTEGRPYCDDDAQYPTADMRWGLVATAGARHWIHIDCDGLCTLIEPLCGRKLWILYSPSDEYDEKIFGDIDQFFNGFDMTNPPYY